MVRYYHCTRSWKKLVMQNISCLCFIDILYVVWNVVAYTTQVAIILMIKKLCDKILCKILWPYCCYSSSTEDIHKSTKSRGDILSMNVIKKSEIIILCLFLKVSRNLNNWNAQTVMLIAICQNYYFGHFRPKRCVFWSQKYAEKCVMYMILLKVLDIFFWKFLETWIIEMLRPLCW